MTANECPRSVSWHHMTTPKEHSAMRLQSINHEQRLYVMPCGKGYSCYGFDVLDRKARAVAAWLADEPRYTGRFFAGVTAAPGTVEHFAQCAEMLKRGAEHHGLTGRRCPAELVPALVGLEGKRVECDYFGERVRFTVGKSTGWLPAHLELKTRRSSGGGALVAEEVRNVREIAA